MEKIDYRKMGMEIKIRRLRADIKPVWIWQNR